MASGYIRGAPARSTTTAVSSSSFSSSARGRGSPPTNSAVRTKREYSGNERFHTNDYPRSYREAEVQNVKAARVYIFGNTDVADDENEITEFEMPEMRSRHKGSAPFNARIEPEEEQPQYFEKEIAEGETLQKISLKYACSVSELKRLNNLIQDQEFFALKVLKVPMKKYGVLSEEVAKGNLGINRTSQHVNGAACFPDIDSDNYPDFDDGDEDSQHDFSDPETQMKVLRTLSIRDNFSAQGKEAEKFLQKMDADLTKFKQSSRDPDRESLTEVISVLTNKSIHPLHSQPSNKNNGADCGISWYSILLVFLVVAIIVPFIYLIYYLFIKS